MTLESCVSNVISQFSVRSDSIRIRLLAKSFRTDMHDLQYRFYKVIRLPRLMMDNFHFSSFENYEMPSMNLNDSHTMT